MIISDDDLLNLPDDPELAFVEYEASLREKIFAEMRESHEQDYRNIRLDYINHVIAAAKAFDIKDLRDCDGPQGNDQTFEYYEWLLSEVVQYTVQIRIKNSRRVKRYSVALNSTVRQKIRHHLGKIKETVDGLDVPQSKKEALFDKIAKLEDEVNRDRTRFDAVMALILETAGTGGEAAKRLEPVRKFIDSITGLLKEAKEGEDKASPRLEAPNERKRIEGPPKKIAAPDPKKQPPDWDDEIPF